MSTTVNLSDIKVLSEEKYNELVSTPDSTLHFVELPMDSYVVESYKSNYDGYIIYSNGLKIQWGRLTRTAVGVLSVSFLENMSSVTYIASVTMVGADSYNTSASFYPCYVTQKTTTGMNIVGPAAIASMAYTDWIVIGY